MKRIRDQLNTANLTACLIPTTDEFMSEMSPPHLQRLQWATGFTGSNGIAIIRSDSKKNAFFTDGRYTLQAADQLDSKEFDIYNITDLKLEDYLKKNFTKDHQIAFNPWVFTKAQIDKFAATKAELVPTSNDVVDLLWRQEQGRPEKQQTKLEAHELKYAGQSHQDKIKQLAAQIAQNKCGMAVITQPESVCWLLNIRARDLEWTPIALSYAIIYKDAKVDLFLCEGELCADQSVVKHLGDNVDIYNVEDLAGQIEKALKNGKIMLDTNTAPFWFAEQIGQDNIKNHPDICLLPKAVKNKTEIAGARKAHKIDGVAVAKFVDWLKKNVDKSKITELSAAAKLLEFRQKSKEFVGPSFETISGFGAHGAIVHYRVTPQSDVEIKSNGLFLVDSGGQYKYGTTDITRTIAIGKPTKEQITNFTLVLKGHLALASAEFKPGTTGSDLDILARKPLQDAGLDYDHGTGHGVGSFLSVHEGPQRISKAKNNVALMPGMILSNEPGYYKEGEYGIRIENLVVVVERGNGMLGFETLTKAPLDMDLVDLGVLSDEEKVVLDSVF